MKYTAVIYVLYYTPATPNHEHILHVGPRTMAAAREDAADERRNGLTNLRIHGTDGRRPHHRYILLLLL